MAFKFGDVQRNLPTKGFTPDKSGDHPRFQFWYNGKLTRFHTYVSHGKANADVGDYIVRAMKMQLGLDTMKQVRELVECTMSQDAYVQTLQASGKLPKIVKE